MSRTSQRATSTAWVFDARRSHQPSVVFTRTPSTVSTAAPASANLPATSDTTANFRTSEQAKRISGVLMTWGSRARATLSGSVSRPAKLRMRTAA